jgi:hypothetical protein
MACNFLVHPCADCKHDFIGSWAEWYCPSCKKKRNVVKNRVSNRTRYWTRKKMRLEAEFLG